MFSILNVALCAALAALSWTLIGLPLALRVAQRPLALPLAPILGWAVHSALMLPIFYLIPMSAWTVRIAFALPVIIAVASWRLQTQTTANDWTIVKVPIWAFAGAALLALAPMMAIVPKLSAEGVALAAPIFDHTKIAMVNEIARLGVPAQNPFFAEADGPTRLSYYYLWHFSAAELSLMTGASGWEADAALSWFTGFASLAMMMGFAIHISGAASSAFYLVVIAATASMRPVLDWLIGWRAMQALVGEPSGFGGWLFQTTWAPQHAASAACVVLAAFLLAQLAQQRRLLLTAVLVLVIVAGFESSAWVGGVTFSIAAAAIGLTMLATIETGSRLRFFVSATVVAISALALAAPFLYDQFFTTAIRDGGGPIAISPYSVLDLPIPLWLHQILNLPAFWLIFLPFQFPAFYLAGGAMLILQIRDRSLSLDKRRVVMAFAALVVASIGASWLLVSTVGNNNDLGWRAILPAVMPLIIFAAAGLSRWLNAPLSLAAVASVAGIVIGLRDTVDLVGSHTFVEPSASSGVFAASPAMWQAVRRHSGAGDRVANNPYSLLDMTSWPANISWALLSNRRSCYAGPEFAMPFSALTAERRKEIDAQFVRIFSGDASPDDLRQITTQYGCKIIVVTAQDGAWNHDPFAANKAFRLVEAAPLAWRIYTAGGNP